MKRQLSLTIVALGFLGTAAWADGMVQPAAAPCCEAPFAGAYIGAAIGYARQRNEVTFLSQIANGLQFRDSDNSFTFGGYVGYNWQHCCSPFVFGIETDFNWQDASPTAFDREPPGASGFAETTSLESSINWFGTLRGRAGIVVHNHLLLYATGGLAYANVDHKFNDDCVGCGNPGFPVFPGDFGPFGQSNDKTKVGWTIGGGAELLHDTHWVLRAEALYVDLGSETHTYTVQPINPLFPGPAVTRAEWDDQFWVARLGVAYKFDSPDCCAAPLK